MLTGHEALAFHTLLSFQGASWNRPATLLMVPRAGPVAGAAATLPWAFQVRQPSTVSLLPPGMPHFSSYPTRFGGAPRRSQLSSHTVDNVGRPLNIPREPPLRRQVLRRDGEPRPEPRGSGLWRHLATSTSDRNAVLRPWAQDGHRSRWSYVLMAVGDLLSSVLTPSWRRRRGLGPRRTILTWCAVKGSTAVEGVSTSYPSSDKGFTARRWRWPGFSALRRVRSRKAATRAVALPAPGPSATQRGRTPPRRRRTRTAATRAPGRHEHLGDRSTWTAAASQVPNFYRYC
jgi:hypothetical protein